MGFLSNSCLLDAPDLGGNADKDNLLLCWEGFFRGAFLDALTNPEDTRLVIKPPWKSVRLWFKAQQDSPTCSKYHLCQYLCKLTGQGVRNCEFSPSGKQRSARGNTAHAQRLCAPFRAKAMSQRAPASPQQHHKHYLGHCHKLLCLCINSLQHSCHHPRANGHPSDQPRAVH